MRSWTIPVETCGKGARLQLPTQVSSGVKVFPYATRVAEKASKRAGYEDMNREAIE